MPEVLNRFSKLLLFLLAYSPVVIVLILKYSLTYFTAFVSTIFLLALLLAVYEMLVTVSTIQPESIGDVTISQRKNTDYLLFIVTYLIPFFGFQVNLLSIGMLVFIFLLIYVIYVDSSMLAVNPLLKIVFRYDIYEAVVDDEHIYILTKIKFKSGKQTLRLLKLSKEVFMTT